MLAVPVVLLIAAQPAPPPPVATRPFRVLVADCVAPGGASLHSQPVKQAVTQPLLATGVVELVPPGAAAPPLGDVEGVARAGGAASADLVLCALVDAQGGAPFLALQLVDVASARVQWARLIPTDGTEPSALDAANQHGTQLAAYVARMHQGNPPRVAPPPSPAPPAPAPSVATAPPNEPGPAAQQGGRWLTWRRAVGITLASVGAALLPVGLATLALAGVGHVSPGAFGPPQLVLVLPGQAAPRFYSPVFTLTWADVAVTGLLWLGGAGLMIAGAVLVALPG